jgi:hypothetical protein
MVPTPTNNPAIEYLDQPGPLSVSTNGVAMYNPYDAGGVDAPSSICFDDSKNCALFCGHQFCFSCCSKLNRCPICRKSVTDENILRLF